MRRILLTLVLASLAGIVLAAGPSSSGFGEISIPSPPKPAAAENCVEPVEIMRRDHMKFLLHQRDETVLHGDRDSKYSLVGCMNCHNPADDSGKVVRYEDPEHFCAACHAYTGVEIDCFECHRDRGLAGTRQSRLDSGTAWNDGSARLTAATLAQRLERADVD